MTVHAVIAQKLNQAAHLNIESFKTDWTCRQFDRICRIGVDIARAVRESKRRVRGRLELDRRNRHDLSHLAVVRVMIRSSVEDNSELVRLARCNVVSASLARLHDATFSSQLRPSLFCPSCQLTIIESNEDYIAIRGRVPDQCSVSSRDCRCVRTLRSYLSIRSCAMASSAGEINVKMAAAVSAPGTDTSATTVPSSSSMARFLALASERSASVTPNSLNK